MGFCGDIETVSVPELFGWVGSGKKSGTLEVERDKIIKRIMFRAGRVVGCSSNEPATLMGQFLLSRGKITRKQLGEAMRRQKQSEGNLGEVLIEMGAISLTDQDEFVANKIEETICGLFDWKEAVFRFYTDELPDPNILHVDLEIRQILERGLKRSDERKRSRETINDPGIVLQRTGRPEPAELAGLPAAKRVFALIDGKKTVAEILLHSHAPQFLVTRFLTALLHGQVLEIVETPDEEPVAELDPAPTETVVPEAATDLPAEPPTEPFAAVPELLTSPAVATPEASEAPAAPAEADVPAEPAIEAPKETPAWFAPEIESPASAAASIESAPSRLQWEPESPLRKAASPRTPEVLPEPQPTATPLPSVTENSRELQEEINVALQLMDNGQPESALELLNAMSQAHPGEVALSKLVRNAEDDYREQMLAGELGASKIPTLTQMFDSGSDERPSAEEGFLIDQIDGSTDIQSLLWITPMPEVDVLKTLSCLLRRGWIEVRLAA
jgi:hypothetical protein